MTDAFETKQPISKVISRLDLNVQLDIIITNINFIIETLEENMLHVTEILEPDDVYHIIIQNVYSCLCNIS